MREFDEAPVALHFVADLKEVPDSGRDVDTGILVFGVLGLFISKNILPVVGSEGTAVLPLGIADALVGDDLDPPPLADCLARAGAVAFKPGNGAGGFRFVSLVVDAVVVGQGDVERIEFGSETFWNIAASEGPVRIVVAAVVLLPVLIPRGLVIGGGIVLGRLFANPEDRGGDEFLPVVLGLLVLERVGRGRHDGHLWPRLGGSRDDD